MRTADQFPTISNFPSGVGWPQHHYRGHYAYLIDSLPRRLPSVSPVPLCRPAQPGPRFFLLVGYAVRYRIRGSLGLCLGIAAGNALYIVLAIVGWGLLRQAPLLFLLIELLGAGYLLWIGSLLIRSRPAAMAVESVRASRPGFGKQLLLGLGSSLLNPKNALFYLALMTSLLGPAVTLLQQTVSGLWMVSVVFFWDLLLVSAIALPQVQRRLSAIVWRVERAAGAILMLFGLWIIWRFLHDLAVRLYA